MIGVVAVVPGDLAFSAIQKAGRHPYLIGRQNIVYGIPDKQDVFWWKIKGPACGEQPFWVRLNLLDIISGNNQFKIRGQIKLF